MDIISPLNHNLFSYSIVCKLEVVNQTVQNGLNPFFSNLKIIKNKKAIF